MRPGLRATLAAATFYAAVNAAIRLAAGTRLAMDDAKTNLFTQAWRWGYQADNPPLFEWLIKLAHPATGGGLGSFLLVKSACLVAAAAFTHLAVRRAVGEGPAFGAAMGLVLLYQVGWNFHQAFTHSALLLAATAAALWAGVRLVQRRGWPDYLLFGVLSGAGLLSKYNFALFALGFLLAALTTGRGRRAVLSPRLLASLAIAGALVLPHALWLADRADLYASTLPETLRTEGAWAARAAAGLGSLAVATISFFVPWGLVYGRLRRRAPSARGRGGGAPDAGIALFTRTSIAALALIVLGVLALGVGAVSERYVLPALLPAYAGLTGSLLAGRPAALRPYLLACLAAFVLFSGVRLATFLRPGPPLCEDCHAFVPYEALAARLREVAPPDAILLAWEEDTAGNLVAAFPEARVTSLNLLTQFNPATPADADRPCYLVWSRELVGGAELHPVFAFAPEDPRTAYAEAGWDAALRPRGFRRTRWGITPLEGPLYARFCAAGAPG